jgi:hypothetical protein
LKGDYGFERMGVVAHSRNGLVSRSFNQTQNHVFTNYKMPMDKKEQPLSAANAEKNHLISRARWCHRIAGAFGVLIMCWLVAATPVGAQSNTEKAAETGQSKKLSPESPAWSFSSALPEKFDWIQLTSGEWLKGDLKVLYNDSLEFESDKLDLLTFDWKDVQQVRCHDPQSVRLDDPEAPEKKIPDLNEQTGTMVGFLQINGNRVFVDTGEEPLEFDRSNLMSIASGESNELDHWSASITLSLDVMTGNTEQVNFSSYTEAKRRTSMSRFFIGYQGIYSTESGKVTGNNHRADSYFDIFETRWFFWRPVFAEYYRDPLANIADRWTIGTGIGYTIIDTAKTELLISPGIAYQATEYDSSEAGESDTSSTPALVVSTEYDTEVTSKIDFNAKYNFNVVNEQSGTYSHHIALDLKIELIRKLDLDLSFIWDRIQDPTPASDGSVPDQDDLHYFCGISFEL